MQPSNPTSPLSVLATELHATLQEVPHPAVHSSFQSLVTGLKAQMALKGMAVRTLGYHGAFREPEREKELNERIKAAEIQFHAADPDGDNSALMKTMRELNEEVQTQSPAETAALLSLMEGGALLDCERPHEVNKGGDTRDESSSWSTYLWPDGAVHVNRQVYGRTTFNFLYPVGDAVWEARVKRAAELFPHEENSLVARAVQRSVYVLVQTRDGLTTHRLGAVGQRFIPENYGEDAVRGFELITTELRAKSPTGRLSIIEGPPGTGKSFFIRGLIEETEGAMFLLVPADMVSALGSPALMPVLLSLKEGSSLPIVLVLEDAEQALAPRMGDNIAHVSSLLNFSDGLYGELVDIRIVASTNTPKAKFDEALLRDGRLVTHIHIGNPTRERCEAVLRRLLKDPEAELPPNVKSLAEVYKLARTKGWKNDARQNANNASYAQGGLAGKSASLSPDAGAMGFRSMGN